MQPSPIQAPIVKRRVFVFTGGRSEYSLLKPIMRAVQNHPALKLEVICSGFVMGPEYADALKHVTDDGFPISWYVPIEAPTDLEDTSRTIGQAILGLTSVFTLAKPDWVVVYGDRYESFAAVVAASTLGIPTVHIEGGDYTEGGNLDDAIRHASTKLAHLHFATSEQSKTRLLRLGEESWRVHNVGLPTLDLCEAEEFDAPADVCAELKLDPRFPVLILCQHSIAMEAALARAQIEPTISAVLRAVRELDVQVVALHPAKDAGNAAVVDALTEQLHDHARVTLVPNLRQRTFHGLLNMMRGSGGAFIGNSSAGIKEAPFFGIPAINIGSRQRGRLKGPTVLDVEYDAEEIFAAIRRALVPAFQVACKQAPNPYRAGSAGPKIANLLATLPLDSTLLRKKMTY